MSPKRIQGVTLPDRPERRHPAAEPSWHAELKPPPLAPIHQPRPTEPEQHRAPVVESEAPASARDKLRDAIQGVRDKAGPVAKALTLFAALTATLTAATPLVKELREWSREEAPPAPKADPKDAEELERLRTRVAVLEAEVRFLQQAQLGVWKAEGYAIKKPESWPEPIHVEITPRPKLPKRTALQPAPEIRLPEPEKATK